ncbi:hypothetical protein EVAR_49600_1 [Eumeta japonica]|uniref:Uncharacterized protein n=1 Tax=Eumeta variegata TaxID=151549 RepID=A0A4C1Y1Q1_EUMVA|nr:hypothetical protein EVAR_49600_1 [Eumeta japonica]
MVAHGRRRRMVPEGGWGRVMTLHVIPEISFRPAEGAAERASCRAVIMPGLGAYCLRRMLVTPYAYFATVRRRPR